MADIRVTCDPLICNKTTKAIIVTHLFNTCLEEQGEVRKDLRVDLGLNGDLHDGGGDLSSTLQARENLLAIATLERQMNDK